jgi:hypothetical protein
MYAKKNKKPLYGQGGMAKLSKYMNGGRIYAENGDIIPASKPESSADPLKSPAVQRKLDEYLSHFKNREDYLVDMMENAKKAPRSPERDSLLNMITDELTDIGYTFADSDVDDMRKLIAGEPTVYSNNFSDEENAERKQKAIDLAKYLSSEFAKETGSPVRNPLYNAFGLEGGPKYGKGGVVRYRSVGK